MSASAGTYLFAWNPLAGRPKSLAGRVRRLRSGKRVRLFWVSGVRTNLPVGSRVFLIKLGSEPRGIVGSGSTESPPTGTPPIVAIAFDTLAEEPLVPMSTLKSPPFQEFYWSIRGSGILIPPPIAAALEERWRDRAFSAPPFPGDESLPATLLPEGAIRRVSVNAYERNPAARAACLAHHGTRCVACGFSFGDVYGSALDGYIHVHHLRPLSSIGRSYKVDPVRDLRPVCPNCHAAIHSQDPPVSVEALRVMIQARARERRAGITN